MLGPELLSLEVVSLVATRIIHCDISERNIMWRCVDGNIYGVLNDFDLALLTATARDRLPDSVPALDHSWPRRCTCPRHLVISTATILNPYSMSFSSQPTGASLSRREPPLYRRIPGLGGNFGRATGLYREGRAYIHNETQTGSCARVQMASTSTRQARGGAFLGGTPAKDTFDLETRLYDLRGIL